MNYILIVTSALFATLTAHAVWRGAYAYGAAWLTLAATSVACHGWDRLCGLDRAVVWLVILIGACYYWRFCASADALHRYVPLACVAAAALLYYGLHAHQGWVHVVSIVGHHVIISAIR